MHWTIALAAACSGLFIVAARPALAQGVRRFNIWTRRRSSAAWRASARSRSYASRRCLPALRAVSLRAATLARASFQAASPRVDVCHFPWSS